MAPAVLSFRPLLPLLPVPPSRAQGLLSEEEMADLEREYQRFLKGEIDVKGRDFCDMSGDYDKPLESYNIINIMLPSKYGALLFKGP